MVAPTLRERQENGPRAVKSGEQTEDYMALTVAHPNARTKGTSSSVARGRTFISISLLLLIVSVASVRGEALDHVHDFEGGELTLTCSGNCPRISDKFARHGRYSIRSALTESSENQKRTEAVIPGQAKKMEFERDYWVGFSIFIPLDWEAPGGMELIAQIHRTPDPGEPGGQPPVAIYTGSGNWKVTNQWADQKVDWVLNSVYEDRGRWTDFVIHYRPSYGEGGTLRVWKNHALVAQRYGRNTDTDEIGPYFKWGLYKGKRNSPRQTVYHDEIRIATGSAFRYWEVTPPP